MRASVSASVDLSAEAHAVKFTDGQCCVACKNRLVEHFPGFVCQLTRPFHPRDSANLNLADHARLGERVLNTANDTLPTYVRGREKSAPAPPLGSLGALGWRNICVNVWANESKVPQKP